MIKRIWWLLFKAPTDYCISKVERTCDYCECKVPWFHLKKADLTICHYCIKEIADKVLKRGNNAHT